MTFPIYERKLSTRLWWLEVGSVVMFCMVFLIAFSIWHFNRKKRNTIHIGNSIPDDCDYGEAKLEMSFILFCFRKYKPTRFLQCTSFEN